MGNHLGVFPNPYSQQDRDLLARTVDYYQTDQKKFVVGFHPNHTFEIVKGRQLVNDAYYAALNILKAFAEESITDPNGNRCRIMYPGIQYGFFYAAAFCFDYYGTTRSIAIQHPIDDYTLKMNPSRDGFSFSISGEYEQNPAVIETIKNIFSKLKIREKE